MLLCVLTQPFQLFCLNKLPDDVCHHWRPIISLLSVSVVVRKMQLPGRCIYFSHFPSKLLLKSWTETWPCWWRTRFSPCCLGWTWSSASAPRWETTRCRTPRSSACRSNAANSSEWRRWRWCVHWHTVATSLTQALWFYRMFEFEAFISSWHLVQDVLVEL